MYDLFSLYLENTKVKSCILSKFPTSENRNLKNDVFYLGSLVAVEAIIYGLETVVSVLFSNTRTRLLYNEREIVNTARSEAKCSIENFEFTVQKGSACI